MPAGAIPHGLERFVRHTAPKGPEIRDAHPRSLRSRPCGRPGSFRTCASRRDRRRRSRAEFPARACSATPGSPDLETSASSCGDLPGLRWTAPLGAASPITVIFGREQCFASGFSLTLGLLGYRFAPKPGGMCISKTPRRVRPSNGIRRRFGEDCPPLAPNDARGNQLWTTTSAPGFRDLLATAPPRRQVVRRITRAL